MSDYSTVNRMFLQKTASEHGSKNYALIFPNAMLWQLAEKTPLTVEEMKKEIDGMPETKINKYGAHRFLDITTKFCIMVSSKGFLHTTLLNTLFPSHHLLCFPPFLPRSLSYKDV